MTATCPRCDLRRDEYVACLEEDSRRADRLQALIDAFAAAWDALEPQRHDPDAAIVQLLYELDAARDAVLAAASWKDDDR